MVISELTDTPYFTVVISITFFSVISVLIYMHACVYNFI